MERKQEATQRANPHGSDFARCAESRIIRKLCLRGGLCDGEVSVLMSVFARFASFLFQYAAWIDA